MNAQIPTLIIVPKTKQAQANTVCLEMLGPYATDCFNVQVLEGTSSVSNHYACNMPLTEEQIARLETEIPPTRVVRNSLGNRTMVANGFRHVPTEA